jgi:hypothetical protein
MTTDDDRSAGSDLDIFIEEQTRSVPGFAEALADADLRRGAVMRQHLPGIAAAYYREGLLLALFAVANIQHSPEEIERGDEELTNTIIIKLCAFLDSGDAVVTDAGFMPFFRNIHAEVSPGVPPL